MRIAVLGAGAMGSWFGGQLARCGNKVQLLTTNQAHLDAISSDGLVLRQSGDQHTLAINARQPRHINSPVDLVLLFTKCFQSDAALASIAHAIDDNTHVLSLQNGLGNADTIARQVAKERIWVGVTMLPIDMIQPGIVACKGEGQSYFGPGFTAGIISHNASEPGFMPEQLIKAFTPTGISLEFDPDIHKRIWEKVAFNAGMNALAALAHGTPGTIGKSAGAKELAQDVAREVTAVASSQGIELHLEAIFGMIDYACTHHQNHKPSMLQDLNAGKKTEIDALCGAVAKLAQSAGIPAPLNRILETLVRLAELSQQTTSHQTRANRSR